ncbi:uncharacterized protein LOC116774846 [Danaus plexippus]|uniref:uncharacterized protein LOC116774846 n=1 Tax=Danaus plexippus TaxID=13037 RepID=UPI002AB2D1FE|nr:uncharacterized protein LOC116774846 [Danaus plexippus]
MLNCIKTVIKMKLNMDSLPTVISCCFCCFLRAGTVVISMFSFISGLLFAPNVSHAKGFWSMDPVLSYHSAATEAAIQLILGIVSIILCIASVLLLVGSICNLPVLILVYQWGAVVYCVTVFLLFFILAMFCFFVHSNCVLAGIVLCGLMVCNVLVTAYFVIVANSLRLSLKFLASQESILA